MRESTGAIPSGDQSQGDQRESSQRNQKGRFCDY